MPTFGKMSLCDFYAMEVFSGAIRHTTSSPKMSVLREVRRAVCKAEFTASQRFIRLDGRPTGRPGVCPNVASLWWRRGVLEKSMGRFNRRFAVDTACDAYVRRWARDVRETDADRKSIIEASSRRLAAFLRRGLRAHAECKIAVAVSPRRIRQTRARHRLRAG